MLLLYSNGGKWMVGGRRTYIEPLLNAISTPESPLPSYYFYDFNAKLSPARTNRGGLTLATYFGRDKIDAVHLDVDRIEVHHGQIVELAQRKYNLNMLST